MSIRLLIIADDLTGAMDTAAQFAADDIPTVVFTGYETDFTRVGGDVQVVSVNTDSRYDSPGKAREKVRGLVEAALAQGVVNFYKKIDSTLRGNVGAELEAALDATGFDSLALIPAYPANNRLTIEGVQYADRLPVDVFLRRRDPFSRTGTAVVADIVREQCACPVVQAGQGRGKKERKGIVVFDAADEADLFRIGAELREDGILGLTAGCAGFALALAHMLPFERSMGSGVGDARRTLVVCGSLHRKSINQMAKLEATGLRRLALLGQSNVPEAESSLINGLLQDLDANGIALLSASDDTLNGAGIEARRRAEVRSAVARVAARVCRDGNVDTLVVIGGDTLSGITQAMGVRSIRMDGELLPGIVGGISGDTGLRIIAKSGAFGKEDALVRVWKMLHTGGAAG